MYFEHIIVEGCACDMFFPSYSNFTLFLFYIYEKDDDAPSVCVYLNKCLKRVSASARVRYKQVTYLTTISLLLYQSIKLSFVIHVFFFKIELVFISIFTSSRDDTMAILKIKKKRGGPSSYRGANHALHF